MMQYLTADWRFSADQNVAIISRDCSECPSRRGEVCVGCPDGFHHSSRVIAWRAEEASRSRRAQPSS